MLIKTVTVVNIFKVIKRVCEVTLFAYFNLIRNTFSNFNFQKFRSKLLFFVFRIFLLSGELQSANGGVSLLDLAPSVADNANPKLNVGPGPDVIKLFYGSNLQMYAIS
jgi:hypothetical protein